MDAKSSTFATLLKSDFKNNLKMWEECLPHVKVVHSTTQYLPYEIVYGFKDGKTKSSIHPITPLDILSLSNTSLLKHKDGKNKVKFVRELQEQVKLQVEQKWVTLNLQPREEKGWFFNPKIEFGCIWGGKGSLCKWNSNFIQEKMDISKHYLKSTIV